VNRRRFGRITFTLFLATLLIGACGSASGGTFVWIDVPLDGLTFPSVQAVKIEGHATASGGVARVEISVDGTLQATIESPPAEGALASFHTEWSPPEAGIYTVQAVAFSEDGQASQPDLARLTFLGPETQEQACASDNLLPPILISPSDGEVLPPDPLLTWEYPGSDCQPEGIALEIAADEAFSEIVDDYTTQDLLETNRTWSLPAGACYFWRARALLDGGSGPQSDVYSFCVQEAAVEQVPIPVVEFLADPAEVQAGSCTTLKWHVENVGQVIFGGLDQPADGSYRDCLCESQHYTLTVIDLDGLQEKHSLDIAVSGSCITPEVDSTPPPAPSPAVPANGLTLACTGSQNLVWLPVDDPSGIDEYQLQVQRHSGDGVWQEVSGSVFSGITDKQRSIPVECGWTYRWRVRAVDGVGNVGSWSAWSSFIITLT
jgi:hypothetical protein